MKYLFLIALIAQPVLAQTLIPATSEDINEFDRQVSEQLNKPKDAKAKSNFGSAVSEEAKKLNEAGGDAKKEFGKWVSSQRKKNDQGRPSAQGSAGSESSAAHSNSEAARANAPGQKKKNK